MRLSDPERRYLEAAAEAEPTGPMALSPFLRGLGMQRARELLGVAFGQFEQAGGAAPASAARKAKR